MRRDYLTFVEVVAIHDDLLSVYGGARGLRDAGALEAALFRPQSGYYRDVIEEAAALWESLVINHPFVDGNKRIGLAATDVFLRLNGYGLVASAGDIYRWKLKLLESRNFSFEQIEVFLRAKVKKV